MPGGYTKKSLDLSDKRKLYPEFVEASPRGLVPALSHMASDGVTKRVVWESLPACEYVDTVFGNGSLMPKDPHERAMVQIWCDYCTNRIQHSYYKALMTQDPVKRNEHLDQYFDECRLLARAMDPSGPFFLGGRFSMLEVAFAPFWQRMLWIGGHYLKLTFPKESEFDRLNTWWGATSKRPSIVTTLVCQPRLVASYSDYALNLATSDFAKTVFGS
jgi:glutathione S-transferase